MFNATSHTWYDDPINNKVHECRQAEHNARLCVIDGYDLSDQSGEKLRFALRLKETLQSPCGYLEAEIHVLQMGWIGSIKVYVSAIILIVVSHALDIS